VPPFTGPSHDLQVRRSTISNYPHVRRSGGGATSVGLEKAAAGPASDDDSSNDLPRQRGTAQRAGCDRTMGDPAHE
jgi:hypothetical protein